MESLCGWRESTRLQSQLCFPRGYRACRKTPGNLSVPADISIGWSRYFVYVSRCVNDAIREGRISLDSGVANISGRRELKVCTIASSAQGLLGAFAYL